MKKWFRNTVVCALAISTALAFGGLTAAKADTANDAVTQKQAVHSVSFFGAPFGGYLMSEVHQQAYLTYLVKEFAPESMDEWKAAFDERKKVAPKMPKKNFIFGLKEGDPQTPDKIGIAVPEGGKEGLNLPKEVRKYVIKLKEGDKELPPELEGKEDVIELKPGMRLPLEPDSKTLEEMKARAQLQEEFDKAVESGDAGAIRSLLPKMLDDYKKGTEQMAKMAEIIKENIKKEMD